MDNNYLVDEFRGTDKLYCAEVLTDDNEDGSGYTTGIPFKLAPVAEISKTTEASSETKFYDNIPSNVIQAEGADTVTLTIPVLPISVLGYILGKKVDDATGALMGGESKPRYFALGYRLGLSDETYRYVWRYKGMFAPMDETSQTKDNTTTTNNQSLTYTGIMTAHVFTKPGEPQRELVVDERDNKADLTSFFDSVITCDTLTPKVQYTVTNTLTKCSSSNAATKAATGSSYSATITADSGYTLGAVTVTMGGTDISSTAVNGANINIANVTGNIVVSCTATA